MRILLMILSTIQFLTALGCYPQDLRLTRQSPVRTVEVLEVRSAVTRNTRTLLGLIEPIQDSILYFEVTGQVRQVFVKEGDIVKFGAPIAELISDDFDLAVLQAGAELTAAQAKLNLLRTGTRQEDLIAAEAAHLQSKTREIYWSGELVRRRSLLATNAASMSEVDVAKSEHEAARGREREMKAFFDRAVAGPRKEDIEEAAATVELRTHALAVAKRQLQKATLRAPFGGRVEKRMVDPGAVISQFSMASVPIVHLVDLQTADAVVAVPESLRESFHTHDQVEIVSAADSSLRVPGTVIALGEIADRASGTCALRVRIDNRERRFYSGMVVAAIVDEPAGAQSIQIPLSTVRQPFGQSPQVLLVDSRDLVVIARDIRLGELREDKIEVLGGLSDGEQIIVRGQHLVVAGDRVQTRQAISHPRSKQEALGK